MLATRLADHEEVSDNDNIIVFREATWADFQRTLEARGDRPVPRIVFTQGVLQLMTPSKSHESLKSTIGRLVETYCLERGIEFHTVGSWTLERKELERGIEPDECYVIGQRKDADLPDLAIEVIWTSGSINKLDVYRAMGIPEVWVWRKGRLTAYVLSPEGYKESQTSAVVSGLNLAELEGFIDRPRVSQSMREYRDFLQGAKGAR